MRIVYNASTKEFHSNILVPPTVARLQKLCAIKVPSNLRVKSSEQNTRYPMLARTKTHCAHRK